MLGKLKLFLKFSLSSLLQKYRMKKVIIFLLVVFVFIQVFRIDKTNPPVNKDLDFFTIKETPRHTAEIIRNSCYDCHSNESNYPWYSNVAPASWMVKSHIDEGRKHLNFSTFATYQVSQQLDKLEGAVKLVQDGDMPLESYLLGHQNSRLTDDQKAELIDYFKKIRTDIKIEYGIH